MVLIMAQCLDLEEFETTYTMTSNGRRQDVSEHTHVQIYAE